jgi:hypothetical protein
MCPLVSFDPDGFGALPFTLLKGLLTSDRLAGASDGLPRSTSSAWMVARAGDSLVIAAPG